jgi:opacity protein-like surface antigen
MTLLRRIAIATLACCAIAAPARADLTAFIGANTTPSSRQVKGGAVGIGLLIVGFEFEYANELAPSLTTGMGNVLLQTPFPIMGFQPYVTTGGGIYHEALGSQSDTNVGLNTGGGVKVTLAGPLRVRVDYRVFKLGGGALNSPAHRIYAGLNLKF